MTPDSAAPPMMDDRTRNRILGVLFVGVLMGALDAAIVGPALPALATDFGVDDRTLSWVLTIYILGILLGTPLMAKLADRAGRRAIYVLDVALFGVGSLIVALSPDFPVLLLGRAIQGLGAGGVFPIAAAVIGDAWPAERRGRALGLIGAVFGLAFILGPLLGGLLLRYSWHWLFYINLPVAAVVVIGALRVLPSTRAATPQPFDWAGLGVLTLALSALALGLNQLGGGGAWPWGLLLLGLALAPLFLAIERRASDPILGPRLFAVRQVSLALLLALGSGICMLSISFLPSLLTSAFAVTPAAASLMLIPLILTLMVGSPVVGRLVDRSGSRAVLAGGGALLIAGFGVLSLVPPTLAVFYTASALLGLGLAALLGAPIRYIVINAAPAHDRTAAQGAISVFTGIGQILCSAVVGGLAGAVGGGTAGHQAGYVFVGLVAILVLAVSLGLQDRATERESFAVPEPEG